MSDIKSMLPVRSAQDVDQRVQTKIVDATNPDTQQLVVDTQGNAQAKVHGNDPTNTDVILKLSEEGRVNPRGDYDGTTNTKPASSAVIAHDRNASPSETTQTKRVSAVTQGNVTAMDVAIQHSDGNPITRENALPTYQVEDPGEELQDYFESVSDVAVNATDVHEYTVPVGKTLKLDQILAAGSGRMKVTIEQSQDGTTFSKVGVRFNSTAEPNCDTELRRIVSIPAGGKVRITRQNIDEDPFTMYSTIIGLLI